MSDFHCPTDWHFSPPCVEIQLPPPPINHVPEPGTFGLLALAVIILVVFLLHRRK